MIVLLRSYQLFVTLKKIKKPRDGATIPLTFFGETVFESILDSYGTVNVVLKFYKILVLY